MNWWGRGKEKKKMKEMIKVVERGKKREKKTQMWDIEARLEILNFTYISAMYFFIRNLSKDTMQTFHCQDFRPPAIRFVESLILAFWNLNNIQILEWNTTVTIQTVLLKFLFTENYRHIDKVSRNNYSSHEWQILSETQNSE